MKECHYNPYYKVISAELRRVRSRLRGILLPQPGQLNTLRASRIDVSRAARLGHADVFFPPDVNARVVIFDLIARAQSYVPPNYNINQIERPVKIFFPFFIHYTADKDRRKHLEGGPTVNKIRNASC